MDELPFPTTSDDAVQLVIFKIAEEEFAAEINQVKEIINPTNITKVPMAPVHVFGVINLRGKLITIIDLHKKLGFKDTEQTEDTRILVSDVKGGVIGMVVDKVMEVGRIPENLIEPPPPMSAGIIDSEYIRGIAKTDDRLIVILDLAKILIENKDGKIEQTK